MSSRQQQQTGTQQTRSSSQTYQKNFTQGTTPQGPPPPYPSPNKRFKTESGDQKPTVTSAPAQTNPPFYLNQQQLQMLHCLQQNASNLTAAQQVKHLLSMVNLHIK